MMQTLIASNCKSKQSYSSNIACYTQSSIITKICGIINNIGLSKTTKAIKCYFYK